MEQASFTVFANFFIDNEERFQRMKDSFYSFKDSEPKQWLINIRGKLKNQAGEFLKKEIGNKANIFYLQSSRGWFVDSRFIASKINSDFIFFWIEDHILMTNPVKLNECVNEMKKFSADQLIYTWFYPNYIPGYNLIKPYKIGKYITVKKLDLNTCYKLRYHSPLVEDFYTVSCTSIMSKAFFKKIMFSSKPYLKRWPRKTPFDFEKKYEDKILPIIWNALPNEELFASIDDNHSSANYSLVSRGLYPNRVSREKLKKKELGSFSRKQYIQNKLPKLLQKPIISILYFFLRVYYTLKIFGNK